MTMKVESDGDDDKPTAVDNAVNNRHTGRTINHTMNHMATTPCTSCHDGTAREIAEIKSASTPNGPAFYVSLHYECGACGHEWMTPAQLDHSCRAQVAARWALSGAPPVEQIKAWRARWGFTAADAAALMGLLPRTFERYEAGTLCPSPSAARLLRLMLDYDTVVWHLKEMTR